ncbi:hypothetical protein ACLOJK_017119 [Asimina triloba]
MGLPLEGVFAPPMASASAGPAGSTVLKSYVQVVNNKSEHPTFKIPMRFLVDINGEMGFVFSELEMTKAVDEFRYALIIATRFGRYLGTDNATLNHTRASGARICLFFFIYFLPEAGSVTTVSLHLKQPKKKLKQQRHYNSNRKIDLEEKVLAWKDLGFSYTHSRKPLEDKKLP